MKRVLEPEVMDDNEQVLAYGKADFSASNQLFAETFNQKFSSTVKTIIDLGCGPGDIPIRLAKINKNYRITAVDASTEMLTFAQEKVIEDNFIERIFLKLGRIPDIEYDFVPDAIISKDLLHHLPVPSIFWEHIKKTAGRNTVIFVMDLIRPETIEEARKIVDSVSGSESEILKLDFYNSLLASFTIPEIKEQLGQADINCKVNAFGDRHFIIQGTV